MGVIGVDSEERIHAAGIVETNFPNGNREQDLKGLARWVVHMPALGNIQRITKRGVRDSVGQICVRSVLARIAAGLDKLDESIVLAQRERQTDTVPNMWTTKRILDPSRDTSDLILDDSEGAVSSQLGLVVP